MTAPTVTGRLLCVAEAWGYGPSAKLFAIVDSLSPRPHVAVACTGAAETYSALNADMVDELIPLEAPRDVLDVAADFDAVLTVMDPWAALLGARRGVPTFYVDSLFWFWNWDDLPFDAVLDDAQRWLGLPGAAVRREIAAALDWHRVVPMAYSWSSRTFVQRTPAAAARLDRFPAGSVEAVGAVIRPPPDNAAGGGPPLIGVSGAISHMTPPDVALRYGRLVAAVLAAQRDRLGDAIVTGHPDVLGVFAADGWDTRPLTAADMLDALAAAPFALVPAGLTTALEAAATRTPLVVLPEQHAGHAPNRDMFSAADPDAYDDLLLQRWFSLPSKDPAQAIADLDRCYARLLAGGDPALVELRAAAASAVDRVLDPAERERRAERQRRCALRLVGDFDGARTVAEAVLGALAAHSSGASSGRARMSSP